jgi:Tim44-like domain.
MGKRSTKIITIAACCTLISIKAVASSHLLYFVLHPGALSNSTESWVARIIVTVGLLSLVTTLVIGKSVIADWIVGRSAKNDPIWNIYEIRSHTRYLFYEINKAISLRDISSLSEFLLPDAFDKLQVIILKLIDDKQRYILKYINIKVLEIVGCEDYKDDSRDKFTAYLEVELLNYRVSESTGEIIDKREDDINDYAFTYQFIRLNNQWKLAQINDSVKHIDVLKSKIWIEE